MVRARQLGSASLGALILAAAVGCASGPAGGPTAPATTPNAAAAPAAFAAIGPEYRVVDSVVGLDTPLGVAVSPDGEFLYVSGGNGDATGIARLDGRTDEVAWLGDGLGAPGGIDTSADGAVWATSRADDALAISRDEGGTWERVDAETGGFVGATSVAAEGEFVAVTNAGGDSVSISLDGGSSWSVQAPEGVFAAPAGAAITAEGLLAVVNSADGSVALSADDGRTWERIGADVTGMVAPEAIAAGPAGELYAADPGAGALSRSVDGGRTWYPSAGFGDVAGVGVGPDGLVYVTDGFDTLAVLEAIPGPVSEATAEWSGDALVVGWAPPAVSGGSPLTSYVLTAEPAFTDEEWAAFAAELSEAELADLADAWRFEVDPGESAGGAVEATIADLPDGRAVRLTLVALNEVGASETTILEVSAR